MASSGEITRLPPNVARVKVPAWTPYASREVPKFFRVNLQLLKLQLPLRRSYLYLNSSLLSVLASVPSGFCPVFLLKTSPNKFHFARAKTFKRLASFCEKVWYQPQFEKWARAPRPKSLFLGRTERAAEIEQAQFRYLRNCPPTPLLSQHFTLSGQ